MRGASESTSMNGRLLLDTNAVIAVLAEDGSVHRRLRVASEVFVPSIALGELYFGAHKSARVAANVARIDDFARSNVVLACDAETASHYGRIKDMLRTPGRPIPENDIWIAAVAQQYALTLLTRDVHCREIAGLLHEKW